MEKNKKIQWPTEIGPIAIGALILSLVVIFSINNKVFLVICLIIMLMASVWLLLHVIDMIRRGKENMPKDWAFIIAVCLCLIGSVVGTIDGIKTITTTSTKSNGLDEKSTINEFDETNIMSSLVNERNQLWDETRVKSEYIRELINSGIRRYKADQYLEACFFFESAIDEGDEGVTAKNNLATMLRRSECVSEKYELIDLLESGVKANDTFALINMALYQADKGDWNLVETYIKEIALNAYDLNEAKTWWENLSLKGDREGDLVLGLMLRYDYISGNEGAEKEYFKKAREQYPSLPDEW